jgi:FkbM family methyltransferase
MNKIGDYWVPDVDSAIGSNLEKTKQSFEKIRGIQIHHLEKALTHCKEFKLAIDGGANIGSWTRVMAEKFEQVHAFEPNEDAFECLERNVSEWNLTSKVTIYNQALTEFPEMVVVAPPKEGKRTVTACVQGKGDTVGQPIDHFEFKNCSFLKLDLEGYEAKAIRGASKTILDSNPTILIENREPKKWIFSRKTEAESELNNLGYRVVDKIGTPAIDWVFKSQ